MKKILCQRRRHPRVHPKQKPSLRRRLPSARCGRSLPGFSEGCSASPRSNHRGDAMVVRIRIIATLIVVLLITQTVVWGQFGDDRYPFVRDGKVGFIDHEGREVIPPRFSNAGDMAHFQDGLAPVFEAGFGSGYIDPAGKFVIGPTQEWFWGRAFHEDVAGVMIVGKAGASNRPAWI